MNTLTLIHQKISPAVRSNEPMSKHTTFKIGGPAQFFFEAKTADDAVKAVSAAKEIGMPMFVFGGGSNMLVSDNGIKGLVIKMTNRGFSIDGTTLTAEAGAPSGLVAMKSTDAGLTGFEWAIGLPGTIGGAVRGNAGMFGGEIKDSVVTVRALRDGNESVMTNAECVFAYRDSIFKRRPGMVVLSATLQLKKNENVEASKVLLKKYLLEKKDKQPIEFPCAGCIFTNWKPENQKELESLRKSLDLNPEEKIPLTSQGTVPAGWIIDRAQMKGMKIGHTSVSDKHGNFFIHDGHGTADEIIQLMAAVKARIRVMTHGIVSLTEEVEYVGF
jgi:UDP-N-acetylmuramate dehydrogenase